MSPLQVDNKGHRDGRLRQARQAKSVGTIADMRKQRARSPEKGGVNQPIRIRLLAVNGQIEHPRIKKGRITPAYKEAKAGEKSDFLISNTYFRTFLQTTPPYWDKLLDLLYRGGRLKKYASIVEDVIDKFSFLFLSRDQIRHHESLLDASKKFHIKYFTYTFIYLTKSFLDSLAVFVNEIFELGFKGGEIDFRRGKFIEHIRSKHKTLGELISERRNWIDRVIKYRDNLIHRHGLYIGPLPNVPPEIKDEKEIDLYILKEPYYLPNDPDLTVDVVSETREGDFIKLTCFIDDWINEAANLLDIVLGTYTRHFIRVSRSEGDKLPGRGGRP